MVTLACLTTVLLQVRAQDIEQYGMKINRRANVDTSIVEVVNDDKVTTEQTEIHRKFRNPILQKLNDRLNWLRKVFGGKQT